MTRILNSATLIISPIATGTLDTTCGAVPDRAFRFPGLPGSAEFMQAYQAALEGVTTDVEPKTEALTRRARDIRQPHSALL